MLSLTRGRKTKERDERIKGQERKIKKEEEEESPFDSGRCAQDEERLMQTHRQTKWAACNVREERHKYLHVSAGG
ncbi:hypothetical protein X777_05371 [Ooceraea biroi]|uniref:Uncharacterized protein n=1 Tax=Ooceraea biroi TaxID=2015173 RepID=A0A026WG03_OOCBI|nr:hypothetical protein X777_05371 [Ooceraea biroi]